MLDGDETSCRYEKDTDQTSRDGKIVSEMKNTLGGINSWLDIVEEKISEFEVMAIEMIHKGAYGLKKIQLQQIHEQNIS